MSFNSYGIPIINKEEKRGVQYQHKGHSLT